MERVDEGGEDCAGEIAVSHLPLLHKLESVIERRTHERDKRPLRNLLVFNFHSVLVLDQEVEGEVQHSQTHGVEKGVHESVGRRRQPKFIVIVATCISVSLARPLVHALLFSCQLEQVLILGDLEQRLLGGTGSVRLAQLDILGLLLLARAGHVELGGVALLECAVARRMSRCVARGQVEVLPSCGEVMEDQTAPRLYVGSSTPVSCLAFQRPGPAPRDPVNTGT